MVVKHSNELNHQEDEKEDDNTPKIQPAKVQEEGDNQIATELRSV